MILLEYEAKQILKKSGIPIPAGTLVDSLSVAPIVLKSQVPTGGRGKLGGIKLVEQTADIPMITEQLLQLPIKGYVPSAIYGEEKLAITHEYYLSILINRELATIQLVAHKNGGVEVESNNPDGFLTISLPETSFVEAGEQLAELYAITDKTFVLQDLVKNLYQCFLENDATLIEINPLVHTESGELVAGDCKMTLDDSAAFRHPDWRFERAQVDSNFVTLDPQGTVATIANCAGLAMATVDAVAAADLTPANFLDIGGGANAESVLAAFRKIVEFPHINAIVINIFAGITRCDEVAKAIIEASNQISDLPTLCIRLAGTNYEEAKTLLDAEHITLIPTLTECIAAAKEAQR
jgi:succinyl-CoA synthetase beta subunit